jgi:hypothetical protein
MMGPSSTVVCFSDYGPFAAMKSRRINQISRTYRGLARSSLPDFRKGCPSRFRSHHLLTLMLPARARTCFEGPFGEVLRATGVMAKANPFRFSTKYQDDETDLLYYGYRYYSARKGSNRRFAPRGADAWAALARSGLLPACKE